MSSHRPAVICATDFSEVASLATTAAAKIAVGWAEPLRVVHVTQVQNAAAQAGLQRRLELEAQRLVPGGATCEVALLVGPRPADTFLDYVRAERPSLVVVGAATKGPVDRWALGSFSEQVAESSPVPTLVLRNPAAFAEWGWNGRSLRILAAVDLRAGSESVLRWVKELGRGGPFVVTPCHVRWQTDRDTPDLQPQLQRELKKLGRDQLATELPDALVVQTTGEIGAAIIESAWRVNADLIVVGTHQRHGLSRLFSGSVSRRLLHETGLNIACVPTSAVFDARHAHIPEYRRVLVATDFSPLGDAAIPFACGACSIGGLVRFVHVQAPSRDAADATEEAGSRLRALVPAETGARCQPPEVVVLQDRSPARAICAEAERFGADLVCMSSHGLGASRAGYGSVARAVLKTLRRPVLIIRRPED